MPRARGLKPFLRLALLALLRASGGAWAARRLCQRRKVTILLYHHPEPDVFRRHLDILAARYSFISMSAYLEARERGDLATLPPRPLVLTFDDGFAVLRDLAPLLEERGVRPTVYLCSAIADTSRRFWWTVVDREEAESLKRVPDGERLEHLSERGYTQEGEEHARQALTAQEISEMAGIVDFQSHTRFHPMLPRCDDERAWDEIAGSKDELRERLGIDPGGLSYPNGDYTARDAGYAEKAGYDYAVTTRPGYNAAATDPFRLRRILIDDDAGDTEVVVWASGLYRGLEPLRALVRGSGGERG